MDKKIIRGKLDLVRGEVISSATRVEFVLGYRLRKYFFPKSNNKAAILFWNIINSPYLTFDNKISIYESIPYFKKSKDYPAIKKSVRFIQRLRNIMAHWDLDEKKSNLKNIFMFTLVGKYRKITINDNLIENY
ncbi:MAG: hypothetical protein Q8Q90_00090, partial [bacterium]|nr:hypothetical protein [bacterium]